MTMFLLGLLVGAAGLALLLVPRLAAAGERAAGHARQLTELRAAAEEKVALVAGSREQLTQEMKAISADALRQASEQVEELAKAQRAADRAIAAGELGKRTKEFKRTLDPIAENLKRVSDDRAVGA
jgi:hypothetical protein